ncbi:MAG: hypothetical protein J6C85_00925 [Alphaproteobacteria bacterium]|nr:hypothetical protein [Alphaproteobacteria bacterium]
MANRQRIPSAQMGGALLKNQIQTVPLNVRDLSDMYDDSEDDFAANLVETGKNYFKIQKENEDKKKAMEADRILNEQRLALANTSSSKEFIEQAKNADTTLKTEVAKVEGLDDFFNTHSDKLLAANRADIKNLYAMKENEFGRNSLDEMLSLNQNMLAQSAAFKGERLLAQGVENIAATPFLEKDEKETYRQEYLKGGILNLALNDTDGAMRAAEKYLPDDSDMMSQISETKRLREAAVQKAKEKQQRATDISELGDAFSYWQAFEKGQIDEATYFVLRSKNREETRVSFDSDFGVRAPLSKAYRAMRRLNQKEELSAQEIKEAGNFLINAYKAGEIGLDEAGGVQNQMVMAGLAQPEAVRLFDASVDALIDAAVGGDASGYSLNEEMFMEEKAKFAFDVYDAFYEKKTALADDFEAAGGTLTEGVLRRLGREAAEEVSNDMGLKKGKGSVSFAALERQIPLYYSGDNTAGIWQKFCRQAPYAEDKEGLFAEICASEERAEAALPRFYSLDEVQRAGLKAGDRFYFQGRLAEIG